MNMKRGIDMEIIKKYWLLKEGDLVAFRNRINDNKSIEFGEVTYASDRGIGLRGIPSRIHINIIRFLKNKRKIHKSNSKLNLMIGGYDTDFIIYRLTPKEINHLKSQQILEALEDNGKKEVRAW